MSEKSDDINPLFELASSISSKFEDLIKSLVLNKNEEAIDLEGIDQFSNSLGWKIGIKGLKILLDALSSNTSCNEIQLGGLKFFRFIF